MKDNALELFAKWAQMQDLSGESLLTMGKD